MILLVATFCTKLIACGPEANNWAGRHGSKYQAVVRFRPPICTRLDPTGRGIEFTRPLCGIKGGYYYEPAQTTCAIEERV